MEVTVVCSFTQPCHGCGVDLISRTCPRHWGLVEAVPRAGTWGLLLQLSISGNDIEARVGGDYPVIKCVCREIRSICIKCFWLSAKVSTQILGEGRSLPFLFYCRWEQMSLLASMAIALSIKLIFPFNGSYLTHITTRLDCRGILMSWHLMVCSHSPGLNGRNWEEGRRRQQERHRCKCGALCISSKPLSFTYHWCSPYVLQLFLVLLSKGTCLK